MLDELPDILSWIAVLPSIGWAFAFYRATRTEEKSNTVFSRRQFATEIFKQSFIFWATLSALFLVSVIAAAGSIPMLVIGLIASGIFYVVALAIYTYRLHKVAIFIWTVVFAVIISVSGLIIKVSWNEQENQLRENKYLSAHTVGLQEGETYIVSKSNISIAINKIGVQIDGRASQNGTILPFVLSANEPEVLLSFPTDQVAIIYCTWDVISGSRKVFLMIGPEKNLVCPSR